MIDDTVIGATVSVKSAPYTGNTDARALHSGVD
jgi:hypothetical protein